MEVFELVQTRERLTQMVIPTTENLVPPNAATQGEGFYVELFLIRAFQNRSIAR